MKFDRHRWSHAFFSPEVRELNGWASFVGLAFFGLAYLGRHGDMAPLMLLAGLILGGAHVYLVLNGLKHYDVIGKAAIERAASRWVRAGASAEEVRMRDEEVQTHGSARALMAADVGLNFGLPDMNIDGSPMIPGTGIDIYGNLYGVVNDEPDNFDGGNDMLLTPGLEYEAPHDMSDMGMGDIHGVSSSSDMH